MNRKQRRHMDKEIKKRLDQEQFEELKSAAIEMRVQEEMDKFLGNFVEVFIPAMREHKISEERAMKIINDINDRATERYARGEKGVPRPKEGE